MWLIYAFGSAFFAGITSILAKVGIKDVDSHLATAIRTIIVLIFSWIMVFLIGSQSTIVNIDGKTFLFLILSGLSTGGSWLCYFKALQLGDVNKVVPIDNYKYGNWNDRNSYWNILNDSKERRSRKGS